MSCPHPGSIRQSAIAATVGRRWVRIVFYSDIIEQSTNTWNHNKHHANKNPNNPLLIIHYQLSTINYPLFIIHYPLSIIHYQLLQCILDVLVGAVVFGEGGVCKISAVVE